MSRFKPGDDITSIWKRTDQKASSALYYKLGDVVEIRNGKNVGRYFLETDESGAKLMLVPIYELQRSIITTNITYLQDVGATVVDNVRNKPLLKILYGR